MTSIMPQLARFGPERCESLPPAEARAWCVRLARRHYENFSVLTRLTPARLRDDFAAVYAFCRWADDLGDETGDPERSRELLSWWRTELESCYGGEARHPVFVALHETITRHDLPISLFDDLISAFEQDQRVSRYETWSQLLEYCQRSANPVGRLVLMMLGQPRTDDLFALSDSLCTALQLTNHWQDVCRDIVERDRIYIPRELIDIEDFEDRLTRSARQGWAVDHTFLGESRRLIHGCCERTRTLYEKGEALLPMLDDDAYPVVWLFTMGGEHLLHKIELWNYETVLHRPTLTKAGMLWLVLKAWRHTKRRKRRGEKDAGP